MSFLPASIWGWCSLAVAYAANWVGDFRSNRERWQQSLWFFGWLFVTGIAAFLQPSVDGHGTHQQLGLPPCPSVLFFDRPCPGCGLTTSWTAFVHGHFAESFHAHPLGPFLYLFFTATAVMSAVGALRGVRLMTESNAWSRVISTTVIIVFGFGIVRMVLTPNYATPTEQAIRAVLSPR